MDKKVTIDTAEFHGLVIQHKHVIRLLSDNKFEYQQIVDHIDERLNGLVEALEMVRFELMAKQGNAITFTNDQWAQILIALKKVRGE